MLFVACLLLTPVTALNIALALAGKIPSAGQVKQQNKFNESTDASLLNVSAQLLHRNFIAPAKNAGHMVRVFVHSWDVKWADAILSQLEPDGHRFEPFTISEHHLLRQNWTREKHPRHVKIVELSDATVCLSKWTGRRRAIELVRQYELKHGLQFDNVILMRLDACACTPFEVRPLPKGTMLMVNSKVPPNMFWDHKLKDGYVIGISDYLEQGTSQGMLRYTEELTTNFVHWANLGDGGGSHYTPALAVSHGLRRWKQSIGLHGSIDGYLWHGPVLQTVNTFQIGNPSAIASENPKRAAWAKQTTLRNYGHVVRCVDSTFRQFVKCTTAAAGVWSTSEECVLSQCSTNLLDEGTARNVLGSAR